MTFRPTLALVPLALLAACGGKEDDGAGKGGAVDPASEAALNTNLMTDPDLSDSNEAGAALSGTGNDAIPLIDMSPQAVAAARKRAEEMVGGAGAMKPLPAARQLGPDAPESKAMVMAARAAVAPGGANCADSVAYSAAWAAKLPPAFPVYPRGNTMEAAGSDEGACNLRIVTFRTPVPLSEVLAFYGTRASAAGFGVEHAVKGSDTILSGTKAANAYVVYGRKLADGATEIDLVTTGGE